MNIYLWHIVLSVDLTTITDDIHELSEFLTISVESIGWFSSQRTKQGEALVIVRQALDLDAISECHWRDTVFVEQDMRSLRVAVDHCGAIGILCLSCSCCAAVTPMNAI